MLNAIRLVGMLPAGESRMELVLRLVEIGLDGQSRSSEVMAISRPNDFGDLTNLGLALAKAKLLLANVQQDVIAAQAGNHALFRPDCRSCGGRCHVMPEWTSSNAGAGAFIRATAPFASGAGRQAVTRCSIRRSG